MLFLGPRFALVLMFYFLTARPNSFLPKFVMFVGLARTMLCGGWVYVTSTDNHVWHDIFMVSYLVFTIPWTLGCLALSPMNPKAIKYRKYLAGAFFGALVPSAYFFLQHKIHKVPGGKSSSQNTPRSSQIDIRCHSLYHLCNFRMESYSL